uniref:Uncharacterized protein n=1 Tax=Arundo donax TaxID=35708 RepID=A0A0A9ANH7_ARUDO
MVLLKSHSPSPPQQAMSLLCCRE